MLHKAGWAIGFVFLLAQAALGQTPEQPETISPPLASGLKLDGPSDAPLLPLEPARRSSLFYVDADYLLWWVNHGPAPTLLTTAPNNGINPNGLTGGILGQPGTQTLFDGHQLGYGSFSGFQGKVGVGLGDDGFWSLELGGFYLPKQSIDYVRSSNGNGVPLLTIPFTDASTGLNQSLDVSSQTINHQPDLNGSIAIHSDLQVWGYELNLIAHSIRTEDRSVDLWLGFRSLTMDENLSINQTVTPAQNGDITIQYPTVGLGQNNYFAAAANAPVFVVDHFRTRNDFYGGQAGTRFSWNFAGFTADLTAKVAVGATHQQASIDGSTTATMVVANPAMPQIAPQSLTTQGGTFALANNIGNYSQNQFSVVPEIGLNLKYAVTPRITLQVGYSATYWSNVARPGDQIDPVLNSKLIPTGGLIATNTNGVPGAFLPGQEQGRPYFVFHDSAFWAQGLNFGVEFRY
jgi:hypothetical protein